MAEKRKYPIFIKRIVWKYLRENYGKCEGKEIWKRTLSIYDRFQEEAPDIGGKENNMASNLYMAIAVFSFHEATERTLTLCDYKRLMEKALPRGASIIGLFINMNHKSVQEKLRKRFENYKTLSDSKLDSGEWGNSWRVEINPHDRKEGVAFDLVTCPLADFAKSHGYSDILPLLCSFDHTTASLMHARLIREHTIAEGGPYCDYWYVGDREDV